MNYKFLDKNLTPNHLASLSNKEREILCAELRDKILNTVSSNGGHLASNLGAVELTVALLSVFDYTKDKIVFDVGHQSYSYKLITGRYNEFDTLRQRGGVSGFPRISESPYDAFDTGHSSTSISAALGMARARDLTGKDNYVISIIGDGAMTGGLAYEALNDAGHSKTKMLVILNDNEMSISPNVGGLSRYLKGLRMSGGYISAKKNTETFINENLPIIGKPLVKIILAIKDFFRFLVNRKQPSFFEDMGLVYYGPIDGHDIRSLTKALEAVKDIDNTVVLHIVTKKGKGYKFAEEKPSNYHGVSPFDIKEGVKSSGKTTFTSAFSDALCDIADKDEKVVGICAAMAQGTGLDKFENKYPERFYDCGIAEEHAVTMAGGLAVSGLTPVVAVYSSFIQRAYDEIIHDVSFMNNHVVFALDRAGFVGADGHTHHGLNDIAIMNSMPNMTVFAPRDYQDLKNCLYYAIKRVEGPCAVRYPRGGTPYEFNSLYSDLDSVVLPHLVSDSGNDFALISIGTIDSECEKAFNLLASKGKKGKHINLSMVKPVPADGILAMAYSCKFIVTVEEGIISGGAGESILHELADSFGKPIYNLGVNNLIIRAGSHDDQLKDASIDSESICNFILGK